MFTTRSRGEAFVGRFSNPAYPQITSLQSQVAEVAWFIRGTTLYRRQLLVRPDLDYYGGANIVPQPTSTSSLPYYGTSVYPTPTTFYALCDLSVHAAGGAYDLSPSPPGYRTVANSLGDLTKRENRFAHAPLVAGAGPPPLLFGWPHAVFQWGTFYSPNPYGGPYGNIVTTNTPTLGRLGLPTLRECSFVDPSNNIAFPLPGTINLGMFPSPLPAPPPPSPTDALTYQGMGNKSSNEPPNEPFDAWDKPNPWDQVDPESGTLRMFYLAPSQYAAMGLSPRLADDIILTNVLSFDLRLWDPTAPVLVNTTNGNVYAPGDAGYAPAVVAFVQNPNTSYSVVSQGAYVDLDYGASALVYANVNSISLTAAQQNSLATLSAFSGPGNAQSGLSVVNANSAAVYDTGSWSYEVDGIDQDGVMGADQGTNGLDDNGNGLIDEAGDGVVSPSELEAPPPYSAPLRGVQIKIRCFEPDSRQIREVTVVQEFVPG